MEMKATTAVRVAILFAIPSAINVAHLAFCVLLVVGFLRVLVACVLS